MNLYSNIELNFYHTALLFYRSVDFVQIVNN